MEDELEDVNSEIENYEEDIEEEELGEDDSDDGEDSNEPAAYTPNLKYSVRDKEFEFDPRVKAAIKSKEDEDYFRDLYTKSGGVDHYKEQVNKVRQAYEQVHGQASELTQGLQTIKAYRDQKNYGELMHSLGINEDEILKYSLEVAKKRQLPQEERSRIDELAQYKRTVSELQNQMSGIKNNFEQFSQQASTEQVHNEYSRYAGSENGRILAGTLAKEGIDLKDEIAQYGVYVHSKTGKDPDMADAFEAVARKFQPLFRQTQPTRQPTLPSLRGGNNSPQGKQIRSIEDLYRLQEELGV